MLIRLSFKLPTEPLQKKYHPDANRGSNESKEKFQEILEAYEVLSDATKRAYYDSMRSGTGGQEYAPGEEHSDEASTENAEHHERWKIIKEYFPDIDNLATRMGHISPNFKTIFQTIVIETKDFKQAAKLGRDVEDIYLTRYFGKDMDIKSFAKKLLLHKNDKQNAQALRELNKTIATLGPEAPHYVIMNRLQEKHDLEWTKYDDAPAKGDRKEYKSEELENSREAWFFLYSLAFKFGWVRVHEFSPFRKVASFKNQRTGEQKHFFKPEEARFTMGIPLSEFPEKLRTKSR